MHMHQFTVTKGHQVASGNALDARFPNGTIAAQKPNFKALGLDLADYFPATINAEFHCKKVILTQPNYSFTKVKWHQQMPAENFKFYNCQILTENQAYSGLIYQPQIETKIEHFQSENIIEILAPYISNLRYGDKLHIICNQLILN